jgi:hypothetical protein
MRQALLVPWRVAVAAAIEAAMRAMTPSGRHLCAPPQTWSCTEYSILISGDGMYQTSDLFYKKMLVHVFI